MDDSIKFLGATVANMNVNLGWGDSPSSLNVTLVEDKGELFIRPVNGTPAVLNVGTWYFGGIIQNWSEKIDVGGNPIYDVILVDPRELLSGVQLILNGYKGNITVPNVFNICGHLQSNSIYRVGGFSCNQIINSLYQIIDGSTPYGVGIKLMGVYYRLDLSQLPVLPDYYKIVDESMSILDFIRRVCDDANHDYFFSMKNIVNPILELKTVNRNSKPVFGAISNFVRNNLGSVRNSGFEFNNQSTSKFLMGGRISKMYYQFADGGSDGDFETDPWENSIWPFWGTNRKNAIIGEGINDRHTFTLDVKHLGINVDYYTTDVGELRAALDSQDTWECYLSLYDNNIYWVEPWEEDEKDDGKKKDKDKERNKDTFRYPKDDLPRLFSFLEKETGRVRKTLIEGSKLYEQAKGWIEERSDFRDKFELKPNEYMHAGKRNPHFGKATEFKLQGVNAAFIGAFLYENTKNDVETNQQNMKAMDNFFEEQLDYEESTHRKDKLYTFIRGIAEEYYGKAFMVRLPFIISDKDEQNMIYTSYEPDEAGFIDEDVFPLAWENNLLPIPYDNGYLIDPRLMKEDGRIYTYARFDSLEYDYSDIPEDCIIINVDFNSVFIKCEVESYFVYQNDELLYSPRAIVKMPGRVTYKEDQTGYGFHAVASFLYPQMEKKYGEKKAKEKLKKMVKQQAGADNLNLWMGKNAVLPTMVGIPLLSDERYGPWYATGADGKTEYEEDDSLVPWEFNSWEQLNNTAQSKILNSISNYQISEFGSITVPGIPSVLIGEALVLGGPTVTNISINYGTEFTTTYNMNTWPVNPYKFSKERNDYIGRLSKKQLDIKRNFLEEKRKIGLGDTSNLKLHKTLADLKKNAAKGNHSSHDIMFAERLQDSYNIVIQPQYNAAEQVDVPNKTKQAISSISNLFIPFGEDLQKVNRPSEDFSIVPNGNTLFPYQEGMPNSVVSSSNGYNTNDPNFDWNSIRGMALRGPLMVSQWGYDTSGFPYPQNVVTQEEKDKLLEEINKDESLSPEEKEEKYEEELQKLQDKAKKEFHPDYLDPLKTEWKTGPVDLRWDDVRKVYTLGGYSFLAKVEDAGNSSGANLGSSFVKCRRYTIEPLDPDDKSPEDTGKKTKLVSTNFTFQAANFRPTEVVENSYYIVHNIDGLYVLDVQHAFLDYE